MSVRFVRVAALTALLFISPWGLVSRAPCGSSAAAAAEIVDFAAEIRPIFEQNCLKCHARGKFKGGLSLENRASLLQGGESGPAVVVGKPAESLLVDLIAGHDPDRLMPAGGPKLSAEQVTRVRSWIEQGAVWPAEIDFGFRRASLAPRRPAVPTGASEGVGNEIDQLLASYYEREHVPLTPVVSDRIFLRRVSLDLVGLLPSAEQAAAFEGDARPDKRARLVDALLADRIAYADHWLTFWNDALRNAYKGTGFIDGGREAITEWLYQSIYDNKPYNQFVHELISPVAGSGGFVKGIVWRGVVNASQVPAVQAAQNVSQVFLGTNLKCASCHDSFVNHWKLADAYALASAFADKPLEIHRCDKPTGKISEVAFIYPELGGIDPAAPKLDRLRQLADLIVKPENGRLSRTVVNRLWAQLMGRGLVEPLDDLDQPAWNDDLLDWLASDLVDHGYDLKHTLRLICDSAAYQRPAGPLAKPGDPPAPFAGPLVKRMGAEAFVDAAHVLMKTPVAAALDRAKPTARKRLPAGEIVAPELKVNASWIWSHERALSSDPGGRILLRRVITLAEKPTRALTVLTCDNECELTINGQAVAKSADWQQPILVDLAPWLVAGENVIALEATNWPDAEHNRGVQVKPGSPGAVVFFSQAFQGPQPSWSLASDGAWLWAKDAPDAWKTLAFDTTGWRHAVELAPAASAYVGLSLDEKLRDFAANKQSGIAPRAALMNDDALTRALGRPNREQVITRRESIATTLQALELTNGETLDKLLREGARGWQPRFAAGSDKVIDEVFEMALGRAPASEEREAAQLLLGKTPTTSGMEDLLWAMLMLPEFQLID